MHIMYSIDQWLLWSICTLSCKVAFRLLKRCIIYSIGYHFFQRFFILSSKYAFSPFKDKSLFMSTTDWKSSSGKINQEEHTPKAACSINQCGLLRNVCACVRSHVGWGYLLPPTALLVQNLFGLAVKLLCWIGTITSKYADVTHA